MNSITGSNHRALVLNNGCLFVKGIYHWPWATAYSIHGVHSSRNINMTQQLEHVDMIDFAMAIAWGGWVS